MDIGWKSGNSMAITKKHPLALETKPPLDDGKEVLRSK